MSICELAIRGMSWRRRRGHVRVIRVRMHVRVRSVWRVVVCEDFARPMVDAVHVVRPVGPCEVIEGLTFAMDATHFVIEVLVGATLPRVIRLGEIDKRWSALATQVKLASPVQ